MRLGLMSKNTQIQDGINGDIWTERGGKHRF